MSPDLRGLVRPGDCVVWGQGPGEPRTLTEAVVAQRTVLGPLRVFLGASYSGTLDPSHADHLRFVGIGGIGSNRSLARAGVLEVLPCHVSAIPGLLAEGTLPVDVVLVQLSPAGPDGRHSLGLACDWMAAAIAAARTVVAEVNDRVPRTRGDTLVAADRLDHVVFSSRPPVTVDPPPPSPTSARIGALVAGLVPDGATVQLGVGGVAPAVAAALGRHQDLGLHCGVLGDWYVELSRSGALTNAAKAVDRGVSVTASLAGTSRLYDHVARDERLELHPVSHTHDRAVLARLGSLVAVNSAIEVDLTGQVNAETVGGVHVGAVGGQVDFVRAAMASTGGRSIIALPSTAARGTRSRIVARLADAVVTTPRSDADVVVTEHGIADLRGASLPERAQRLIAVADPAARLQLSAEAARLC